MAWVWAKVGLGVVASAMEWLEPESGQVSEAGSSTLEEMESEDSEELGQASSLWHARWRP